MCIRDRIYPASGKKLRKWERSEKPAKDNTGEQGIFSWFVYFGAKLERTIKAGYGLAFFRTLLKTFSGFQKTNKQKKPHLGAFLKNLKC